MLCIPGDHVSHQDLAYYPWEHSAITSCTPRQVIVAELGSSSLHIHQLPHGEKIRHISHTELGLEERHKVFAVHCAGNKLYLVVGRPGLSVESLRVYEVRPHLTVMMIQTNVSTSFLYSYKIYTQHSIPV